MLKPLEWARVQVWQPSVAVPYDMPELSINMLYFPEPIDMDTFEDAVYHTEPHVVIVPMDTNFGESSMHAHVMSNPKKYETGIIMQGQHGDLDTRMEWAHQKGYVIVLHPGNFFGGSGGQDKSLWQMHQGDTNFHKDAWYHLATSRPLPFDLPGRWTYGGDFVGSLNYGQ